MTNPKIHEDAAQAIKELLDTQKTDHTLSDHDISAGLMQGRQIRESARDTIYGGATNVVLADVLRERLRQDEKWGADRDMPSVRPVWSGAVDWAHLSPEERRRCAQSAHNIHGPDLYRHWISIQEKQGSLSWCDILQEELSESVEAAADGDLDHLYAELVQVAAVAVAWAENVRRKKEQGDD